MDKKILQSILLFLAIIILINSNTTLIGKYTNILDVASTRINFKSVKSIQSDLNLKSRIKSGTQDDIGFDILVVFKLGESYTSFERIIPSILKTILDISSIKTIAFIQDRILHNHFFNNSNAIHKF